MKRILFGPFDFPQQCAIGLCDPQSEISVWLDGAGISRDVTHNHTMACAAPFTVGVGFDHERKMAVEASTRLSLSFYERAREDRLLIKIGLRPSVVLPLAGRELYLFTARNCRNYCLPRVRLWMRYMHSAYRRWRQAPEILMTSREAHAMVAFFVCPRPVVLVSVAHRGLSNVFPMNLMGSIGKDYFAFSLNSTRPVTSLVERAGKVALSSIPLERASLAYEMAKNHRRESVDWRQLPFPTKASTRLGLPVPEFSLRVREIQIEVVRKMGSHTLFVGRTIQDEHWADGLQFFTVHGMYQTWRQRNLRSSPSRPHSAR